jgi:hypothetical protein
MGRHPICAGCLALLRASTQQWAPSPRSGRVPPRRRAYSLNEKVLEGGGRGQIAWPCAPRPDSSQRAPDERAEADDERADDGRSSERRR